MTTAPIPESPAAGRVARNWSRLIGALIPLDHRRELRGSDRCPGNMLPVITPHVWNRVSAGYGRVTGRGGEDGLPDLCVHRCCYRRCLSVVSIPAEDSAVPLPGS